MGLQAGEIILNDNQATFRDLLTFHTNTFKGAQIDYTVKRGDLVEQGTINLSYNKFANTAQITSEANFDNTGVLFCATVKERFVRLLYTSTSTGIVPIFKHSVTFYTL
jgi:hypothetical protein